MLNIIKSRIKRIHEKANKKSSKRAFKAKLKESHPFERGRVVFEENYPMCTMGHGSYGLPEVFNADDTQCNLTIGKFCSIADGVKIILGGRHITNWATTSPMWILDSSITLKQDIPKYENSVTIENDVWIATNSLILSPVKLGNGCVVAAGAVVTKDVPPYAIVGGNPAKIIRYRFSEEVINRLLVNPWWERSSSEIKDIAPLLCSDRIVDLLEYLENTTKTVDAKPD